MMSEASVPPASGRHSVAVLVAVTVALYANTLLNGFTIDDGFTYADNPFAHNLANVIHLFDARYFAGSNEATYRPLCTLTYFLDAALWGNWSGGPHLTNLALVASMVAALFAMFRALTGSQRAAFLGAALFALHPVHAEAVNNISFREDLLACLLLPLSWLAYHRATRSRARLFLPLAWTSYLLAALSKELALVFPVLVLLLEAAPAARQWRHPRVRAVYLAGLILCTIVFLLIRFRWMQFAAEGAQTRLGGSLAGTLAADVKIQARYVLLFLLPWRLQALYPASAYTPDLDAAFFLSLSLLSGVGAAVLIFRRSRCLLIGAGWWIVAMGPVANLYPIYNPMAERYVLWPSVGACLWAGCALETALQSRRRRAVLAACLAAAAAMAAIVIHRNTAWRDDTTLWQTTARTLPDNPLVLANLATAAYARQDYTGTIALAEAALANAHREPRSMSPVPSHIALGSAWYALGSVERAAAHFQLAERYLPARFDLDAAVFFNLGLVHDARGELTHAVGYYERAAALTPERAAVWRHLAAARLRLGDRAGAEADWARARARNRALPAFADLAAAIDAATRPAATNDPPGDEGGTP
jgi:tetratricopeptide (TPR) repeat protein